VAQQETQRAQFIVEKAKQERQQKIVQAEGEAAAAKMVSIVRRVLGCFNSCPRIYMGCVISFAVLFFV